MARPVPDRETVNSLLNKDGEFAADPENLLPAVGALGADSCCGMENEWTQFRNPHAGISPTPPRMGINMFTCFPAV